MATLFDIIKQNKEGNLSSIPVLQRGGLFENFKKGLGLENNNNYKYINHKDENKKNNFVNNLEWCTQKMNLHRTKTRRGKLGCG